jgi:uncharacterized protein YndB with AHSA1/START domain
MTGKITIEVVVAASPAEAWRAYTSPDAITQWNFATPEWSCPSAEIDLREGGRYLARMEARDGSFGFDFAAVYEDVDVPNALTVRLDDGRRARTTFEAVGEGTRVKTVFDPEAANPADMQRDGWQAILDNFKAHVEASSKA